MANWLKICLITVVVVATLFPTSVLAGYNNGSSRSEILDFIIHIFVPREEFWEYQFDRLDGRLREKLPFQTYIDTIGRLRDVSGTLDGDASIFDITYEIDGQQFQLDIGRHIEPHLYNLRMLVAGLYTILLVYYNYRQIMFLIRGTTFNQGSNRN